MFIKFDTKNLTRGSQGFKKSTRRPLGHTIVQSQCFSRWDQNGGEEVEFFEVNYKILIPHPPRIKMSNYTLPKRNHHPPETSKKCHIFDHQIFYLFSLYSCTKWIKINSSYNLKLLHVVSYVPLQKTKNKKTGSKCVQSQYF